jgi:cobalamin-dependent methionine synthase I
MVDYALMNQLLFEGHHEQVRDMTEAALAEGQPVRDVLEEGLIAGMKVVGEDFKWNRVFVPEVLLAARAMKAGMAILQPLLIEAGDAQESETIVMGTVKGDLHDIGKNLVGMMAEGAGFTIVDLGTDTSAEEFIEAAREHKAAIVGVLCPYTGEVEHDQANNTAYANLLSAASDFIRKIIHIAQASRAGANHFSCRKFESINDKFGVNPVRLGRPDVPGQPFHQR